MKMPLRQAALYRDIAALLGETPEAPACMDEAQSKPPASAPATELRPQKRALLVEDNVINQQVALRMLRRLGFEADVASNGREALDAMQDRSYCLVLMDCQMPVMDGLQATAAIRIRESPGRRTPIIAMTAGVMQADRDRCFEAGMDDFIPKPIDIDVLGTVLDRWSSPDCTTAVARPEPRVLDPAVIARLKDLEEDGKDSFVADLFDMFLDRAPAVLASLRAAGGKGDPTAVRHWSHLLKGTCANVGAQEMMRLASVIEEDAAHAATRDFATQLDALEAQLELVKVELARELQPRGVKA
jgi:CheY-like chemotaxis protein